MPELINRQWLLARRPRGAICDGDFRWVESPAPEPGDGELLLRTLVLSCDPTQRGWMSAETYLPPVRIGEVMRSLGVAEVVSSRDARYRPGELVQGLVGWQEYAVARADGAFPLLRVPSGVPVETAMSVLGYTGITAYFGLVEVGALRPGETVVVSGAAGATGSVAAQLAKLHGCRVVGIAGGAEKCRYLSSVLGLDAAIDYKADNVLTALRAACPRGIDLFFDNVGGKILDAALAHLALHGRVVLCGAISGYNDEVQPPGPRNYLKLLVQRGRMEGFVVLDYLPRAGEAIDALSRWLREGKLVDRVDVQHGLENAPAALARLFSGENRGKQLLRIAEPGAGAAGTPGKETGAPDLSEAPAETAPQARLELATR